MLSCQRVTYFTRARGAYEFIVMQRALLKYGNAAPQSSPRISIKARAEVAVAPGEALPRLSCCLRRRLLASKERRRLESTMTDWTSPALSSRLPSSDAPIGHAFPHLGVDRAPFFDAISVQFNFIDILVVEKEAEKIEYPAYLSTLLRRKNPLQ